MRRRDFITLVSGAMVVPSLLLPLDADAQTDRVRRIGVLAAFSPDDPELRPRLAAFRDGLEKLGWSEGRNIIIETRYAVGGAHAQDRAKELIALHPDVIFANSTPVVGALQRESHTTPVIFVGVSDPIGSGFVASLARPGGNLTGLLLIDEGVAGKWVAMLKGLAPGLERAALLANPRTTPYEYFARSAVAAAQALSIELVRTPVSNAPEIETAIESFSHQPNVGLILPTDPTITSNRDLVIALTARYRLPAIYALRGFVKAGGLMSYGTDRAEEFRHAAIYIDRILRGEKPSDLPVQAPTKYETAVNLKTAKALGLSVPQTLLATADEVIE
jgi:putative ABC transport system substrate-binding protein